MPQHVADEAFRNPELQRLSAVLSMGEDDYANRLFPHQRVARAEITLHNNQIFMSEWFEPKWDATAPPAQVELEEKFHSSASPILGQSRTDALHQAVLSLDKTGPKTCLTCCLSQSTGLPAQADLQNFPTWPQEQVLPYHYRWGQRSQGLKAHSHWPQCGGQ